VTVDRYFGSSGLLSSVFPDYEPRPEQLLMSEAIDGALDEGEDLIVEAGTGVGKSLAYLIPLIGHVLSEEGRRAVVSTYTKTLQRQLIEKELPFLREHVFGGLRFALCLGSENYLCLRRLEQANTHGLFEGDGAKMISRLRVWAKKTAGGIRSEIDVPQWLWQKVCRESDLCYGKDCRKFDVCLYQKAKMKERSAHILVTNHHLFFAHVASGWNVIPQFTSAVFDEAHELEDVAADYLGVEFSNYRLRHLLDSLLNPHGKGLLSRLSWLQPSAWNEFCALLNLVRMQGDQFFCLLSERVGDSSTLRVRDRHFIRNDLSETLAGLADELKMLKEAAVGEEEEREITALASRSDALSLSLQAILDQEMEDHVYWAERDGKRLRVVATPLDIASIMKNQVFGVISPAILTSATLTTQGSFDYIKERLGLPDARTLLLRSPFDYHSQAVLCIPDGIGEPGSDSFEEDLVRAIREVLGVTKGRTLVLFTSYHLMMKVYDEVDVPGIEIIKQGDMDNYRLMQAFRKNRHTVLFGTYTFWQGIDVPGDDLQCVVITKLPFAVPDEPVTEARMEALEREGKNPFTHYQVPQAVILLKQGFGRLIRTKMDRGAVVVMDSRVRTRSYGPQFIKSLPECKIAASFDDIACILKSEDRGKERLDPVSAIP